MNLLDCSNHVIVDIVVDIVACCFSVDSLCVDGFVE